MPSDKVHEPRTEIHLNGDVANPKVDDLLRLAACEDALALTEFEHDPDAVLRLHTDQLRTPRVTSAWTCP